MKINAAVVDVWLVIINGAENPHLIQQLYFLILHRLRLLSMVSPSFRTTVYLLVEIVLGLFSIFYKPSFKLLN